VGKMQVSESYSRWYL